jgi:hypothetical protein
MEICIAQLFLDLRDWQKQDLDVHSNLCNQGTSIPLQTQNITHLEKLFSVLFLYSVDKKLSFAAYFSIF